MIAVFGINHKTSPIEIREKYSISDEELVPLSEQILQNTEVTELVVLSTCNRTELYFYHSKSCKNKTIKQLGCILNEMKGISEDYSNMFYTYTNKDAVSHLFKVTSGIDSMLIGENQVVKQVKESYLRSTKEAYTGAILMRMFQKSFETSKRVRSKTKIQFGATSLSYVAADLCHKQYNNLEGKKILVIGAGDTGKIAISHLVDKGADNLYITNRTYERSKELAHRYNAEIVDYSRFKDKLEKYNTIIVATNAREYLLKQDDMLRDNLKNKHQLLIDLSVPRNIDVKIGEMENKKIIAIDDLQQMVNDTNTIRRQSFSEAQNLVDKMVNEFYEWYETRKLRPIIKAMTKSVKEIETQELKTSQACYTPEQYKMLEEYSGRLSRKVVNALIKQLKNISQSKEEDEPLEKIKELFNFSEDLTHVKFQN